jgi:DNA-binding MarR family transcriptional regulator
MYTTPSDKKKKSVDFALKATWLAVAKMYNTLGTEYDVSHSIGFVLLNIDAETGTPATKIAPLMGMEARSLTRILKSLEEEGLIERKSDEDDKRKVIIKLTKAGLKKREISKLAVKEFNKRVAETVPQKKLDVFFEVIDQINKVVDDSIQHNKGLSREDLQILSEI